MAIAGYNDTVAIGEMFEFLDVLRLSGSSDMLGSDPFLRREFGLNRSESGAIISAWEKTFDPHRSAGDRASDALEASETP